MSCQQCVCNLCAKSVELSPGLFTPGEATEPCFTCDECHRYDGEWWNKPDQKWRTCERYQAPAKLAEIRERVEARRARKADRAAQERRLKFKVIRGGRGKK